MIIPHLACTSSTCLADNCRLALRLRRYDFSFFSLWVDKLTGIPQHLDLFLNVLRFKILDKWLSQTRKLAVKLVDKSDDSVNKMHADDDVNELIGLKVFKFEQLIESKL